ELIGKDGDDHGLGAFDLKIVLGGDGERDAGLTGGHGDEVVEAVVVGAAVGGAAVIEVNGLRQGGVARAGEGEDAVAGALLAGVGRGDGDGNDRRGGDGEGDGAFEISEGVHGDVI